MKLSVYTPTHDFRWLKDCWESIESQACGLDVEWVVVPNGQKRNFGIGLPDDDRIKIFPAPSNIKGVGALKKFAVEHCTGDAFVELDHDDVLLPGCLDAIARAMDGGGSKFFYSSTWETKPDGTDNLYKPYWGWAHGLFTAPNGEERTCNLAFPADWRSLCEIFYAPNHVRAWSREAYENAGGYDAKMGVCDDQDLICRTYLTGAEFILHEAPLYHQRGTGANTQITRNAEIQKVQGEVRDKYLHRLAKEWCAREGLEMVDLGGAFGCPEDFTPVDVQESRGLQVDLSKDPLPFADHSVGFVRAVDFLEHIPIGRVVPLINEIHRVLAPGGLFYSLTPSTDGRGAWQDPTHLSFWNSNSWWYYTRESHARYVPEITAKFQTVGMMNRFLGDTGDPKNPCFNRLHNIVHVEATLAALHGQRQPGAIEFPR